MTANDVFISYARDDRDVAREIAKFIEARGFSVWWDRDLLPGNAYAQVIEDQLDAAKAVIVLWSEPSRRSHWVRDEAAVGRDRNRLIPVALDSTPPPLGFRQIQTADLAAFRKDPYAQHALMAAVSGLCGKPAPAVPAPSPAAAPDEPVVTLTPAAAPNDRPVRTILKEEKRQRGFMRTFWLTSFVISAIVSVLLTALNSQTSDGARYQMSSVALGSFFWMGFCLVVGRFFIVVGRRLSKRKSVRYLDGPTLIVGGLSIAVGLLVLFAGDTYKTEADKITAAPLVASMMFVICAAGSIPVGLVRGLRRVGYEDGR